MKPLTLAVHSLAAASLLALGAACTSDTNPFDIETPTTTTSEKTATIRLEFNVAETRAGLITSDEEKLNLVSIYVFNEEGKLEKYAEGLDANSPKLEVSVGSKTVYAIAGNSIQIPVSDGMTKAKFESTIFDSPLSSLTSKNGFMMVGKSDTKSVYYTVQENEVPATNIFNIELFRLVAKTQVKMSSTINTSGFGFSILGESNFRAAQTCNMMQIIHGGSDIINNYQDYTAQSNEQFERVIPGDFTAENCKYLTENIVKNPTTGNTTFIVLKVPFAPTSFYTFEYTTTPQISSTTPGQYSQHFYAVAVVDESNGYVDYTIDPLTKHVYAFQLEKHAQNYANALNGGAATAMTVSEDDAPMRAPRTRAGNNFQVVKFDQGYAYYRINIKDGEEYKVERNKYYKITVNSITSLGCHSEDLLRPTNPNTALDSKPTGTAMIGATFKVKEWDEVNQGVDIE